MNTVGLEDDKMEYIKSVIRSRVPKMPGVELWKMCRNLISKACQTLRGPKKRRQDKQD